MDTAHDYSALAESYSLHVVQYRRLIQGARELLTTGKDDLFTLNKVGTILALADEVSAEMASIRKAMHTL